MTYLADPARETPTMPSEADPVKYRSLRAPRANRSAVIEPPLDEVGSLLARNIGQRGQYEGDLHGLSLAALTERAREELGRAAIEYTASYAGSAARGWRGAQRILLAGHQPQLFHAGVWFKNFALGALGERHGATAINLVIDSDTLKSPSLRMPAGSAQQPRFEAVAFDRPMPGMAYEVRPVLDGEQFAAFGGTVARRLKPFVANPLIDEFWPMVQRRLAATGNLGAALAQARHLLELEWGSATLELPQGRVCDTESFRWFAAHLLAELPRFIQVYNSVVHEYRVAHRIRNAAQPVPNLAIEGDWHEAPFWIWTAENPHRRRFFVKRAADGLMLCDCEGLKLHLPLAGGLQPAVDRLGEWAADGVKIRSRALVTTLWGRLVLSDLFLHGIGGANYDQVTDRLMQRFFGVAPPGLMVLSATLHLPVAHRSGSVDDLRGLTRELRDLEFHPEKQPHPAEEPARTQWLQWVDAKRRWIDTPPTRQNAKERCRAIRAINEAMQPLVATQRARLEQLRAETTHLLAADRVLGWREYAFCLFPRAAIQDFLTGLLPKTG
jgi:hypothetical protein